MSMVDTVRAANGINAFLSGCICTIVSFCLQSVWRKCHVPMDRLS